MPVLPDKNALGGIPDVSSRGVATIDAPKDLGTGVVAGQLVAGAKKLADTIVARSDEEASYQVQKLVTDFDLEQEKRLDDAKRETEPAAANFTSKYRSGYDESARRLMQQVPAHMKPRVDQILVDRGAKFEKRAYDFELAERDRFYVDDVNKRTSDYVTKSMSNPETAYDNEIRGVADINKAPLSQRAKLKAINDFRELNAKYAIETSIRDAVANGDWAKHEEIVQRLRRVPKGVLPTTSDMPQGVDAGDVLGSSYRFFLDKGLEPHQAAAIAGNMRWESGGKADLVNPNDNRKNSPRSPHSIGIGQWNDRVPALIDFARKAGVDVPEGDLRDVNYARQVAKAIPLATQLDFAWSELNSTEKRAFEKIRSAKDLREATEGAISYHRPAGWTRTNPSAGHGFSNRLDLATQAGRLPTKAKAPADGVAPVGAVERTDLPDPMQLVKEDGKPAVDPETGQPSTDIGVTKSDMPKEAPKPATESGYDLIEDGEARTPSVYDSLSPRARHALLKMAREGGRTQVEQRVKDDIARLKDGYSEPRDKDGRTALERYKQFATPMQYEKAKRDIESARLEYQDLGALRRMTAEAQEAHISNISAQYTGEDGYAKAEERRKKAQSLAEKISKERDRDPAGFVYGAGRLDGRAQTRALPNTREALRIITESRGQNSVVVLDGQRVPVGDSKPMLTRVQETELLIEARMKDQQQIMPDTPEKHRHISRAEAAAIMALPKKKLTDDREYDAVLKKAAARAEEWAGPKYAKAVLKDALDFFLSDKEHDHQRRRILAKVVSGEPVLREDYRRMAAIEDMEAQSLSGLMAMADRAGRGAQMPQPPMSPGRPAIAGPVPPTQFPTERGLAATVRQPDPDDVAALRSNPSQWQLFDRAFGPGASARVLGNPASDSYKKTLPKSPDAEQYKQFERKPGWLGR